jgi:hypothetical protein
MTSGYSGDPAGSTTDAIRLMIGDISTTAPILSDDEVEYYYAEYGNVTLAASYAAASLSARYASQITQSSGEESAQFDQLFQHYKLLAADLMGQYQRGKTGFTVTAASQIGVIRDSVARNFPPRQHLSDIKPEEFGTHEV